MYVSRNPEPILASEINDEAGFHQFWWTGSPGARGAKVITTDEFGMRWTLDADHTHFVTQRVAAGLLDVSLMTINKWVREGHLGEKLWRKGVSVIPMPVIEAVAVQRGILLR